VNPTMIVSLLCTILIVVTLGYVLVCIASPFGRCRHCHTGGHLS
jgi:hypothetical protein